MMPIPHGDNQKASRSQLSAILSGLKKAKTAYETIDGEKLRKPELESILLAQQLFGRHAVVIENLLSRPASNDKKDCLKFLAAYRGTTDAILWERKEIAKTTLDAVASAKPTVKYFKLPMHIFTFVNSVTPDDKQAALTLLHDSL